MRMPTKDEALQFIGCLMGLLGVLSLNFLG